MKIKQIKILLLFIFLYIILVRYSVEKHDQIGLYNHRSVLWSDRSGYNIYLPSTLIYQWNIKDFPDSIELKTGTGFVLDTIDNKIKTKYPYGVSLCQSPFWIIAHLLSPVKDGFSYYYQNSINYSGVFYYLAGIFFLFFLLIKKFTKLVSLAVILSLSFGTNLFYYATIEGGMSHIYSFCFFSLLLNYINSIESFNKKNIFFLSLIIGTIVIIRPINILFVFIIFLNRLYELDDLIKQIKKLFNIQFILISATTFLIFISPLLIYNYYCNGSFTLDSYKGEGFSNIFHPQILGVAFAPLNGLFIYAPLILILSIYIVFTHLKSNIMPITLMLGYIVLYACWSSYFLGCGFGHRGLVDFMSVFALPMGIFISKTKYKALIYSLIILCCYYTTQLSLLWYGCFFGNNKWDYEWLFKLIRYIFT